MIRNPIDIASRTSPELSGLIEAIVNQLDSDEPVTLAAVRSFIENELPVNLSEDEHLHRFDTCESLVDELDALIEGFGESAAAIDFVSAFASEPLSRAIETVLNDENRENPPTLGTIREALASGLAARLIGDGVLEEDEADMLMPEIEELIERSDAEALAENFLRYE
jgi:hypothetical protein